MSLGMLPTARIVAGKDLRLELRSRVALMQVLPFALVVLLLFGFALDADRVGALDPATPGLYWIAVLLTLLLAVGRTFALETADGAFDALRMSALEPAGLFLGKAAALLVELFVLDVVLLIGVVVLYDARLRSGGVVLLVTSTVLTSLGLAAIGTLYGALSAGAAVRETLLPLLLLPVAAPVLIGATRAFQAAFGTGCGVLDSRGNVQKCLVEVSEGWQWVGLLAVFATVFTAVGLVAFGPMLEDA
jgi:heme exporter protein B